MGRIPTPRLAALALACTAAAWGVAGCTNDPAQGEEGPRPTPVPTASTTAATSTIDPAAEADSGAVADADPECLEGSRFENLDWIPPSRFALWIDRSAEEGAAALAAAPQAAKSEALPIFARFEFDQLAFGLPALDIVLGGLDLAPAELLLVHDADGIAGWMTPAPCDYEGLMARAESRWGMTWRRGVSSQVGRASDASGLPFDLVLLEGERMAVVPQGRGQASARWLRGEVADLVEARPGEALEAIPAAPLRLVLRGAALGTEAENAGARSWRGDAQGLHRYESPAP